MTSTTHATPLTSPSSSSAHDMIPADVPRTISALFALRVSELGPSRFIKCGGEWISWSDFDETTSRGAAGLQSIQIDKGTRLAYLSQTSMPMLELYFAALKAGVTEVPLNVFLKGEFLRHQLAHSGAVAVAVDAEGLGTLLKVLALVPAVKKVILLEDLPETPSLEGVEVIPYAVLRGCELPFVAPEIQPHDLHQVMYSSGTTGPSKGCRVTHQHAVRLGAVGQYWSGATHEDIHYSAWPMNHTSGMSAILQALYIGIPVVIEPTMVVGGLIDRMSREGATFFVGLGPVPQGLLSQPPRPTDRHHSIRMALIVPCPVEMQLAIEERYGFAVTTELYGQSECSVITATPTHAPQRSRATAGKPVPDVEVVLLDDEDRRVPTGEVGEICIRPRSTSTMFDGYLDDPEATLRAMTSLWFHTGDMGRFDEQGCLTFVDRKKDMMRRSGENVSSFELEMAIREHPDVLNVAVHETSDVSSTTNDIVAWLVLRPGAVLEPRPFAEFLWDSVPYFALPRYVCFSDELPTTASGRVMKYQLRERSLEVAASWDLKDLGLLTPLDRRR
jgi:crotonobetaine/carnitine-CoA ligase